MGRLDGILLPARRLTVPRISRMDTVTGPPAAMCDIRFRSLEFHLPGDPHALDGLEISDEMRGKLPGLGQEFSYFSEENSTEMAIVAARSAVEESGIDMAEIGLVISAPTLITSYGLEIPAIAVRNALGLWQAECLNVAQGCVGFLSALRLASQFLSVQQGLGNVLVVTACKASTLMDNLNHGSFFWADAAAAAVVTSEPGGGLKVLAYGERSSDQDWGAMRLRHGDRRPYTECSPGDDLQLTVDFPDERAQLDYIVGEQLRCDGLISALLKADDLEATDIEAVFLPSIGANRIPHLLRTHKELRSRVKTDFRYAHMGSVDALFFLDSYLKRNTPCTSARFIAMTPAYTAQWGGVLLGFDT